MHELHVDPWTRSSPEFDFEERVFRALSGEIDFKPHYKDVGQYGVQISARVDPALARSIHQITNHPGMPFETRADFVWQWDWVR